MLPRRACRAPSRARTFASPVHLATGKPFERVRRSVNYSKRDAPLPFIAARPFKFPFPHVPRGPAASDAWNGGGAHLGHTATSVRSDC
jgi:hypothetical protein